MNCVGGFDAVVCLAAGKSQRIVINKAKAMGYAVLAVDRDPTAPGFALSDERIELSTYEAPPIIDRLRALQRTYRLVGVVNASSGPPVVTAADICQAFGLPGVPPESARVIVDKSQLMAVCAALGIATPACQSAGSLGDINGARLRFPCVVKPALSLEGKSGVRVVKAASELPDAFDAALRVAMNGIVNIEEFVPGRDVTLMAVVEGGRLRLITLIDELNSVETGGGLRGVGRAVPSLFSDQPEEARILALARQIVDHFELGTTTFLMSCRCDLGGSAKLIEIHLEIGGDLIFDALMPAATSFDVLGHVIRSLVGNAPNSVNIRFLPAAVIYGDGEGLLSERPYDVLTAPDRAALERELSANGVCTDV